MTTTKNAGGVRIECLLTYTTIGIMEIKDSAQILFHNLFQLKKDKEVIVFTGDFLVIDYNKLINTFSEVLKKIKNKKYKKIILNFEGKIDDVEIDLSISFDLNYNVINISVPEKQIISDSKLFNFFGNICKTICKSHPPEYAIIGEESFLSVDVTVNKLKQNSDILPYSQSYFSESLNELYRVMYHSV